MARLTIAQIHAPDGETPVGRTQQVSVSATTAAILAAAIGIIPAFTTAVVDWLVKSPLAAQVQQADIDLKAADAAAKQATTKLELRRLGEAWLRSALEIADENKRAEAVKFVVSSGLASQDFKAVSDDVRPPQLVTVPLASGSQSSSK